MTLQLARQRVLIEVGQHGLSVAVRGLCFTRRSRFSKAELRDVAVRIRRGSSDQFSRADFTARLAGGSRKKLFSRYGAKESTRVRDSLRVALWPERISADFRLSPPASGYLTATSAGDTIKIHMGQEPVGQVFQGAYYVGLAIGIGMPCFTALILVLFLEEAHDPFGRTLAPAMCGVVALLAVAIGMGLCMWAKRKAKRVADIVLAPDEVRVDISGPGDPEHYQWNREAIHAVRVGTSKRVISENAPPQLHVILKSGETKALFAGRYDEDLAWLASCMEAQLAQADAGERRAALLATLATSPRIHDQSDAADGVPVALAEEVDDLLKGSNIRRIVAADRLILEVVPLKWRRVRGPSLASLVVSWMMALFFGVLISLASIHTSAWALLGILPFAGICGLMTAALRRLAHARVRAELTETELILRWDRMMGTGNLCVACSEVNEIKAGYQDGGDVSEPDQLEIHMRDGDVRNVMRGFRGHELTLMASALNLGMGLSPAVRQE
jgi:hypothetical protein